MPKARLLTIFQGMIWLAGAAGKCVNPAVQHLLIIAMSLSTSVLPAPQTGEMMPFASGAAAALDYAGPQQVTAIGSNRASARIVRSSSAREKLDGKLAEKLTERLTGQNRRTALRTVFHIRTVKDEHMLQRPAIMLEHY